MKRLPSPVICGYEMYTYIKDRYPKREVQVDAYSPTDCMYWFSLDGEVRQLSLESNVIMACDYENGFPYMKPIRRLTSRIERKK